MRAGSRGDARTLGVYTTDESASFLGERIGELLVELADHVSAASVPLTRPLAAGEHIVVVDQSTGDHETAGTVVEARRPEIVTTDKATYLEGKDVTVLGRNFSPDSIVTISGLAAETTVVNDRELRFTALRASNSATNFACCCHPRRSPP